MSRYFAIAFRVFLAAAICADWFWIGQGYRDAITLISTGVMTLWLVLVVVYRVGA